MDMMYLYDSHASLYPGFSSYTSVILVMTTSMMEEFHIMIQL